MQTLFFHNLAQHLVFKASLSFDSCIDLCVHISGEHYIHSSEDGAKQGVMYKQALIFFCRDSAYTLDYIIE